MPEKPPIHRPYKPTPKPRPSSAKRGYDWKWRQVREQYLRDNPHCLCCRREGRGEVPATCVDHVTGHDETRSGFWNTSTWAASCKSCNSRWAASHEGAFGNPRKPRPDLHHLPPKHLFTGDTTNAR